MRILKILCIKRQIIFILRAKILHFRILFPENVVARIRRKENNFVRVAWSQSERKWEAWSGAEFK